MKRLILACCALVSCAPRGADLITDSRLVSEISLSGSLQRERLWLNSDLYQLRTHGGDVAVNTCDWQTLECSSRPGILDKDRKLLVPIPEETITSWDKGELVPPTEPSNMEDYKKIQWIFPQGSILLSVEGTQLTLRVRGFKQRELVKALAPDIRSEWPKNGWGMYFAKSAACFKDKAGTIVLLIPQAQFNLKLAILILRDGH